VELFAAEGQHSWLHLGEALGQQQSGGWQGSGALPAHRATCLEFPWALMLTLSQPSFFTLHSRLHKSGFYFCRQTRNVLLQVNNIEREVVAEQAVQGREGKHQKRAELQQQASVRCLAIPIRAECTWGPGTWKT